MEGSSQENPNFQHEKVYVAIVQYFPNNKIYDLENQFYRFIFNALRYAKVVPDDSFKHIQYSNQGYVDKIKAGKKGKTEVYITAQNNRDQVDEIIAKL